MKYIITESKLNSVIYDFMDELFGAEIHTLPGMDDNGDELVNDPGYRAIQFDELVDAYDFVNDEYYDDEGSDYIFSWTGEGYYKSLVQDGHIGKTEWKRLESLAPLVEIFGIHYKEKLNGYFGNTWKPVFKQWFKDKTGMDYKTLYGL